MAGYSETDVRDFYDTEDAFLRTFWDKEGSHHWGYFDRDDDDLNVASRRLDALMAEHGRIAAGHEVLDVGCGNGVIAAWLARNFRCRVNGLDLSPVRIRNANAMREAHPDLRAALVFTQGSATSLPYPDKTFDRAWSQATLFRVPGRDDALREVQRVLKPGGIFVFDDVSMESQQLRPQTRTHVFDRWNIKETHSRASYMDCLRAFGFEISTALPLDHHLALTFKRLGERTRELAAGGGELAEKYAQFTDAYAHVVDAVAHGELGWTMFVCRA